MMSVPLDLSKFPQSRKARDFAIQAHGDQCYGEHPYVFHLDQVAAICTTLGEHAVTLAYLHDVVEDTAVTLGMVESGFGVFLAECVALLSDQPGLSRRERKAESHRKLAAVEASSLHRLALQVKTADRLANVRHCVLMNNDRLLNMYRREHPMFRESVAREGMMPEAWEELERLLVSGEVS